MPKYLPATEKTRAKNLIKPYLRNGLNQHKLAKELGISPSAVNQRVNRPIVQKTLQKTIDKCLTRAGISKSKVYKRLDEQLDATKVISAVVVNKKDRATSLADGELFDANEKTNDFIDVPDHQARDKAIDKSLVLMGHLKKFNDKPQGDTSSGVYIYIVKDGDTEKCEGNRIQIHPAQESAIHKERQVSV